MRNAVIVQDLIDCLFDFVLIDQAVQQDNAVRRKHGDSIAKRLLYEEIVRHIRGRAADIGIIELL